MGGNLVRLAALSAMLLMASQPAVACAEPGSGVAAPQSSSTKPVTLADLMSAPVPSLCQHAPGALVNGKLPGQAPHTGHVDIARNSLTNDSPWVAFGDLNGDGVDDGVMATACSAGGVAWPATVQLYSAGPTHLGGIDLSDVTHGGRETVTGLSISDGVAHVSWLTQGPGDGMCCGTINMTGDLRATGSGVNIENVRQVN